MPTFEEITRHTDPDPTENPWVDAAPPPETITIIPYDPDWPHRFQALATDIRTALGDTALDVEHVGSTSVEHLAAKDVIDIDLTVADPRDEALYIPALERLGYVHTVREPSFHEHRCLRLTNPRANLHVFGPDCPETIRHRMFREWLRTPRRPPPLRGREARGGSRRRHRHGLQRAQAAGDPRHLRPGLPRGRNAVAPGVRSASTCPSHPLVSRAVRLVSEGDLWVSSDGLGKGERR
jgi:GrpB-like predicted nucleotidyltransferase (UPF0157 family)